MKRTAGVVMDLISAEDIGKFPDANIADALQRVTGVQISQNAGGEGRYISIRGLGSQYNVTTYNGRVLATDGSGRDFSYDVPPAEILGSASVYKTSSADMVEGSIGGLVELTTINPLSRKGLHFAGSVGAYDDTASKKVDPRASIAISNTFSDDTLGVLFGFSYYKRHWRSDTYQNLGTPSAEYVTVNGSQASACSPSMTYATPCSASGKAAYPGWLAIWRTVVSASVTHLPVRLNGSRTTAFTRRLTAIIRIIRILRTAIRSTSTFMKTMAGDGLMELCAGRVLVLTNICSAALI
jgi:TonB-dependent receptor